ncbi:hypothetical protein [Pseudoduganella sp.]|uniref:immunity protein Imm33 domain-containing protein n=1 Tax=Pseudoduganella sp. TaxID=1880898 RepID=UPI0035B20011
MSDFAVQKEICHRFGATFLPYHQMEKVGIALATLSELPLNALRVKPVDGVSGWYIWGGEYSTANDFFEPLHISHLQDHCGLIVPYLGLAPGWRVQLAPGHEDVWFDESTANE